LRRWPWQPARAFGSGSTRREPGLRLDGGGGPGAQGVSGEQRGPLPLGEVRPDPGGQGGPFDGPGHVAVRQPVGQGASSVPRHPAEQGPRADPPEPRPGLHGGDGAAGVAGAASHGHLPPARLAAQGGEQPHVHDLDPSAPVHGPVTLRVKTDQLGPPETAREAQERHGPVTQAPQVHGKGGGHGQDLLRRERGLPDGRPPVAAPDPGQDGGDVAVAPVEPQAAVGSGSVEAANRVPVTARTRRSGQGRGRDGARGVLTFRAPRPGLGRHGGWKPPECANGPVARVAHAA